MVVIGEYRLASRLRKEVVRGKKLLNTKGMKAVRCNMRSMAALAVKVRTGGIKEYS